MGTVVYNVIQFWKSSEKYMITLYVPEELDKTYTRRLKDHNVEVKVLGKANYFKWEQVVLPRAVKQDKIDVLWCPYNTAPLKVSCPTVVTVHDMIYMSASLKKTPSLYKKAGLIYRRTIVPKAIKKAKTIITISQFTKKEICNYFPNAENKIQIVYNSTDINTNVLNDCEKNAFFIENNIQAPYILGFGSLETRKNSLGLIKAYEMLPTELKQHYQLVLFGFRGYEDSEEFKYINEHHIDNVVILKYISDEEKTTLYRNSELFVFPTFSEGFGIPVLEAFANASPVITSNVTAIPEVAGDAAILIDPFNTKMICDAMNKVLSNEALSKDLIMRGENQLKKFDWKLSSEKVYEIIKETMKQ